MTSKTGSAHSRYAGLLPIEPPGDFFRPIDLKPERVDLVPFRNRRWSAHKRPRSFPRFVIAFCTGVAGTLLWQSYGDAAREMIASLYPLAPRPAPTAQNSRPPNAIALAAPAVPSSAEQLDAMSFDLDAAGQNADKTATTIAAGQEPMTGSTDATATTVAAAPSAVAGGVTVESRADEASSQPTARVDVKPADARPPQTLSEKEKPLASCFPSASAVLQNHPGGWPTWTMRAPGHEGAMCWYAAARPRGSDHRESVARREVVGTTETKISAPPAPYGRGGSWEGGTP